MSEGDGLLMALKSAASSSAKPARAGESGAEAAFRAYKDKGDLASFKRLIDEVLDEAEADEDED